MSDDWTMWQENYLRGVGYDEAYEKGYQEGVRLVEGIVIRKALKNLAPERVSEIFQVPLERVLEARDEDGSEDENIWKQLFEGLSQPLKAFHDNV